jgi:phage-related protein
MTVYKLDPEKKAWKLFGVSDELLNSKFNGRTLRELADELLPYNVIRGEVRMTGEDVIKNISGMEKQVKRIIKRANVLQVHSKAAEFIDKLGGAIESEAITASFLLDFDRLNDVRTAAYSTNEAFVNYQNITQFEK